MSALIRIENLNREDVDILREHMRRQVTVSNDLIGRLLSAVGEERTHIAASLHAVMLNTRALAEAIRALQGL